MYIYRDFLENLFRGNINLTSDYCEAILLPEQGKAQYIPSPNDKYTDIICWENPDIPHHQARLDFYFDEEDNSLVVVLPEEDAIIWSNLTANIKSVVLRRVNGNLTDPNDDILVGYFDLKKVKHLNNSDFKLYFKNYCFKFKQF